MTLLFSFTTNEDIEILVKKQCITKEQVDVIVNSTRDSLQLDCGALSSAIYKAAGNSIQKECSKEAPKGIKRGHVVETSAGNLPANSIYHGSLSPWLSGNGEADLITYLRFFLDKADTDQKTSIAIPAIATGHLGFPRKVVAKVIIEEILKFSRDTDNTTLTDIRIILDDKSEKEFSEHFDTVVAKTASLTIPMKTCRKGSRPTSTASPQGQRPPQRQGHLSSLFGWWFGGPTPPEDTTTLPTHQLVSYQTKGGITVNVKQGPIAHQKDDVIVNVTKHDLHLDYGMISSTILKAAGSAIQKECSDRYPDGVPYGEVVETSAGNMACKTLYHGAVRQWSSGKGEKNLRSLMEHSLTKVSTAGYTSVTYPPVGPGIILSYPPPKVAEYMLDEIEQFSQKNTQSSLKTVNIVAYMKDKGTVKAFLDRIKDEYHVEGTNNKESKEMPDIPVPKHWVPMTEDTVKAVDLASTCNEYRTVAKRFTDKGGPDNIQKIERIQCKKSYQMYAVLLKSQTEKAVSDRTKYPAERTLYHGTAEKNISDINILGFNRTYATVTLYGHGCYFAEEASYSARDTYSPEDDQKLKRIYQCRVLTGEYTTGSSDLKVPPPKHRDTPEIMYDSVVDDVQNPSIFVVFHDWLAFPEYLITFKK